MAIRVGHLSDEGLHAKSMHVTVKDGVTVTVWRYRSWEPFTWHYRVDRNGEVFEGKTFTRWGAQTEAGRFARGVWGVDE